jgi:hypothetical protein
MERMMRAKKRVSVKNVHGVSDGARSQRQTISASTLINVISCVCQV